MPKLEDLELRIKQTGDLKASTPKKLAESLERLSAAVKGFPKSAENISELNSAIKSIDAAKATALSKAATAIGRLAEQTEKVDVSYAENISVIGAAIEQMINGINVEKLNSIGEALGKFRTAVSGLRGASPSTKAAKAVKASSPGSAGDAEATRSSTTAALEAFAEVEDKTNWVASEKQQKLLEMLKGIGVETENATDRFKDMRQVLEETSVEDVATAIYKLNEAVNEGDYDKISKALREAESAFAHLPSAMEEAEDKGMRLRDVFKDLAKATLPHVVSGIKKIGKDLLSMGWDKLKSKVTGLIGPLQNLVSSFARIAMYRALRTAIKAITSGFSEGIKHLYEWSALVGNNFKQSMDSLATSAHYLRDSLGAMASPLIDALAPAVEFLVDKFVNLLNVVNQFIATFTGASSWRKAVRTPTEYSSGMEDAAKSTKKATEAQKKLNKALMDFDEIHLITTSTSGGSNPSSPSGSGGASGIDSTHFVEEPIADWIQAIKDAINNGDWYGAGSLLADKLNSIIDNWDAKAWGQKLGQKIENGIKFYLGFMENFHWENLGVKLGEALNGIFDKVDPKDLGNAMVAHIKAAIKVAKGLLTTIDLSPIGEAFGEAANSLFSMETTTDLGEAIAGGINNIVNMIDSFVTTVQWDQMGRGILNVITTAIEKINWSNVGTALADLGLGIVDMVIGAIEWILDPEHIFKILGAVYDFVSAIIVKVWDYLTGKIVQLLKDFWEFVKDNFQGGNEDDGNNRKDSYGSSSVMQPTQEALTPNEATQSIKFVMDKNSSETMDKINEMNKALTDMGNTTYKPKIKVTTSGLEETEKALNKVAKTTWTGKLKIKPVLATKSGTKTVETAMTLKQFNNTYKLYTPELKASGGFPNLNQGSMFIAGEVPGEAEMVGNIHGKTGVASGKEITGIADAVYTTGENEAALLREQNKLLRQLLGKNMSVNLAPNAAAGKWVAQAQVAYAKASG